MKQPVKLTPDDDGVFLDKTNVFYSPESFSLLFFCVCTITESHSAYVGMRVSAASESQ